MGKRWKKDFVKCYICKKEVLRKDTKEVQRLGENILVCKKHPF